MSISKFLCSQIPKEENPLDGRLKSHSGIPRATWGRGKDIERLATIVVYSRQVVLLPRTSKNFLY